MADQVQLHKAVINDKIFLQFDFPKHLDEEMAINTIPVWKEMYQQLATNEKANLVFNCEVMTGFDTEARRKWQTALKDLKNQTGSIWIVSENIFILGAAKTMGILAGFPIKVTRSLSEVGK